MIERPQGVGKRWAEPSSCGSKAELQRRLEVVDRWQRERYPAVRGRARLEAYPGLSHSGRSYEPAGEDRAWELRSVRELMAAHRAPRQVDRQGKLSVYNRPYWVGLAWAGATVWVGFDPVAGAWSFQDERGREIRRQMAEELTEEAIMSMAVTSRRRGAHAAKPPVRISPAELTVR